MESEALDTTLATIFYTIGAMIILSLFVCSLYETYQKYRRNSRNGGSSNPTITTIVTNSHNKVKIIDLTLQYCVITIMDEPLIGTIRTIDEEEGKIVADFGNEVMIEFDKIKNNETSSSSSSSSSCCCSICLNEYVNNDIVFRNDPLLCRHIFHTECILKWIQHNSPKPECPCCRSYIAVTKQYGNSNDTLKLKSTTNEMELLPTTTTTTTKRNTTISSTTTTQPSTNNSQQMMEA